MLQRHQTFKRMSIALGKFGERELTIRLFVFVNTGPEIQTHIMLGGNFRIEMH